MSLVACVVIVLLLPLRLVRLGYRHKKVFSLWTGAPIVTMPIKARAERLLGYNARTLVTHTYYITDAFDYNLSAWRNIPVIGLFVPFAVFVWACLRTDRLHFYCDSGILPPLRRFMFNPIEAIIYKVLSKEIFFWAYGADVRSREKTQALGEPNCCTDCTSIGTACICSEALRKENFSRIKRFATNIFSMGDMIEYTPGSRNDLFYWPIDLSADDGAKYRPAYPLYDTSRPLRIVHAPNHRMFKGTRFLEQAVADLCAQGYKVELSLVERVPNHQALELYRSADIIFDQCLIGFHGYLALEGMALGKPVMCFIRHPDTYLLCPDKCPLINVTASSLVSDIRKLLDRPEELHEIGLRGRVYVENYFSIEAFSRRLQSAYAREEQPNCV